MGPGNSSHETGNLKGSALGLRDFWSGPWGYPQAVAVNSGFVAVGWILHAVTGTVGVPPLVWPWNIAVLACYSLGLLGIALVYGSTSLLKWLSGIPMSITTIVFFATLCLLAVLVPQSGTHWLTNVLQSWPFLFITFALLTALGLVTFRRTIPYRRGSVGFLLNHGGLWLTIVTMLFGAGDMTRLKLSVLEGESSAKTADGASLPFEIHLKDFVIEEYRPRLLFLQGERSDLIEAEVGKRRQVRDHRIEVVKFLPSAIPVGEEFQEADMPGSVAAALVRVTGPQSELQGWISHENSFQEPRAMRIDDTTFIALSNPAPKRYLSHVTIVKPGQAPLETTIQVNRPLKVDGWKIYQSSFDSRMGRWSRLSVFDVIRDPWLPAVYTGLFAMLAGLCSLLWSARRPS